MYKKYTFLSFLFLFLFSTNVLYPQISFSPRIDSIINLSTIQTMSRLDRELSGDTATIIGGVPYTILSRHYNSPHNPKAAQYIYEKFQSYGYTARYMDYRTNGTNVYAVKNGTKYPNKRYIICGHYDDMPTGALAPGADDNASGTCSVVEAARLLAPYTFDYTIIFVAFDEEELGLIGSKAFADSSYNRGDSIVFVINLDMIAYDSNNDYRLDLRTNTSSTALTDYVKLIFNMYQPLLQPFRIISTTQNSDHASFWNRGYKAFLGIEYGSDFNAYYHTVNDNFSHVNVVYFTMFNKAAIASLMTFAWDYFMNFVHTPIQSSNSTQPQIAVTTIQSPHPIAKLSNAPRLYYRVNNGPFSSVNAFYNNLDTFKFSIPGQAYGSMVNYYLAAQDSLGRFVGSLPVGAKGLNPPGTIAPPTFFTYSIITGIAQNNEPETFSLSQNYPNPFNASTNISFRLAKQSLVKIAVYDQLGREISEEINDQLPAGEHVLRFDAKNFASGVYFYAMFIDGEKFDAKKMVLSK